MKTTLRILLFSVIFLVEFIAVKSAKAQTVGCPNADFSNGNFANWIETRGRTNGTLYGANWGQNTYGNFEIINTPGNDPNVPVPMIPPGYSVSARLNYRNQSYTASKLEYVLNVTAQNALFVYNYAVIFGNASGHTATSMPWFRVRVIDQNGNLVDPCTEYEEKYPGVGYQQSGTTYYKNWTKAGVDLTNFIGTQVTIEFSAGSCNAGASNHWGYAYIVAECQAMEVDVRYCVGDTSAVLVGPPGFESYQWNTGATTQAITINNPQPGTTNYSVTVTSNGGACQATLSVLLSPVIVTADFSDAPICNEGSALQNTSTVNRGGLSTSIWSYGDGSPIDSSSATPNHLFPGPGQYDVTLIAVSQAGCKDTITKRVTVLPDPVAAFTAPGTCGLTANFIDNSYLPAGNPGPLVSWNWSFGTGHTSTQQNPTFTYPNSGTWNVRLIVTDTRGCSDTSLQTYRNLELPMADFAAPSVCYGVNTQFTNTTQIQTSPLTQFDWRFGDGNSSTVENPSHGFFAPGDYNVNFIVENADGCRDTIVKVVTVNPLPQVSFSAADVCERLTTSFTDNSTISNGSVTGWDWSFDHSSLANSNQQNPTVLYPSWGHYNVTLIATSDQGCQDSLTRLVNVWPRPVIDFEANPLAGCYPFDAVFTNNTTMPEGSVFQYQWSFGDGGSSGLANPTYVYPNKAGNYTVVLYALSDKGCADSLVRYNYITVWPSPVADFSFTPPYPTELNSIVQFHNHSVGALSYYWDFNNGTSSSLKNPFTDFGEDTTSYLVNLISTNEYGCTDTTQHTVIIRPEFNLYIPNSFTPNNDKVNDRFLIVGRGVQHATLMIFNRWGQHLITLSGDQPFTTGWDGTYNGERMKPDVYSYKLQVKDAEGLTRDFHGHINLLR